MTYKISFTIQYDTLFYFELFCDDLTLKNFTLHSSLPPIHTVSFILLKPYKNLEKLYNNID